MSALLHNPCELARRAPVWLERMTWLELGLSPKIAAILMGAGFGRVEDLARVTRGELVASPNVGPATVEALADRLLAAWEDGPPAGPGQAGASRGRAAMMGVSADPCELARQIPAGLAKQEWRAIGIPAVMATHLNNARVETIEDLARLSFSDFRIRNKIGPKVVKALQERLAMILAEPRAGPSQDVGAAARAMPLIAHIARQLGQLSAERATILRQRMGWDTPVVAMQAIADAHGLTRQGVGSIEDFVLRKFKDLPGIRINLARIAETIAGAPAPLSASELEAREPWLAGLFARPTIAEYLLPRLFDPKAYLLGIGGDHFLAGFDAARWKKYVRAATHQLRTAIHSGQSPAVCHAAVTALLGDDDRCFADLLWATATAAHRVSASLDAPHFERPVLPGQMRERTS